MKASDNQFPKLLFLKSAAPATPSADSAAAYLLSDWSLKLKNDSGGVTELAQIVDAPASASAAGRAGQIAYDASYVYVCVAASSWKRASLSAW